MTPTTFTPINCPISGDEEKAAVLSVLESQLFTVSAYSLEGGPHVKQFESDLSAYCGVNHAVATSSGTSALETALLALHIGRKARVLIPSLTFLATANAVRSVGAIPIFCDVDDQGQLDYERAKRLVEDPQNKIKCIILVDLYGRVSVNADQFKKLGVPVIEDACQALGTPGAGTHGTVGCFSFYAAKVITTAGMGGACVVNGKDDSKLLTRLKLKRNHGIYQGNCASPARNNLMPEINAAFGVQQLKKLPGFIDTRLANIEKIGLERSSSPNGYMGVVLREDRDALKLKLNELEIGAATYYDKPIHHHTAYYSKSHYHGLDNTEMYAKQILNLPVHPGVTDEVLDTIREVIGT